MATLSFFQKIKFSQNKKQVSSSSGDARKKCRSTKWWLHWGSLEGQTWTRVEGNMAFDWLINGYPSLYVVVWLGVDYTLRALTCLSVMHIWLLLFIGDVHMLIISIDSLTCFCIVTLLVVWLSCFPWHVYSHFCISHYIGMIYSLCCILSCLSQHIVHSAIYLSCLYYFYLACV